MRQRLALGLVWAVVACAAHAQVPSVVADTTLPEPTSSFGAAVLDGGLYVYGGHVAPTHAYSTESVSGRFARMNLTGDSRWEDLPGGPSLQGLNLAPHDRFIYRVGGMAPRNAPNEAPNYQSVADVARFDTVAKRWEELPPLPEPRSSHDVVVVNDRLIVMGGWSMQGDDQRWADTVAVMDLGAEQLTWRSVPQHFRRRALVAAAYRGKVYVMGGMTDTDDIVLDVSIYDPETESWDTGPSLPQVSVTAGFAPAAVVHRQRLYVSVSDGSLFGIDRPGQSWVEAGTSTPRVAHRLVSAGENILVIGGAARGTNFDLVETIHAADTLGDATRE